MASHRETFRKAERLCSKKTIAELFEKGRSFFHYSIQVIWIYGPDTIPYPAQVAFSVSKKSFRNAVARNLIKRRLREAYRKNKHLLYSHLENRRKKVSFFLIYKGNSIPDYRSAERAVVESLNRLVLILKD